MARSFGRTVSELGDTMTVDEVDDAMRYASETGGICPFFRLERAVRESAAMICLTMANIHTKGKNFKLDDFMIKREKALTADDEITAVTNVIRSIAGAGSSMGSSGIKWARKTG